MLLIKNKTVFVRCKTRWVNINLERQTHGSLARLLYNILKCKVGIHTYVPKFFMSSLKTETVCCYCNKTKKET